MNYRKAFRLKNILHIAGIAVLLSARSFLGIDWAFYSTFAIFIVCLIASFVILVVYYKCPHCGKYLSFRQWSPPTYCPHCGEKLD